MVRHDFEIDGAGVVFMINGAEGDLDYQNNSNHGRQACHKNNKDVLPM